MLDELMGRARATLIFATQPSDSDTSRLVAQLQRVAHKRIVPTIKVDQALLGGAIVELESKTYDGSLISQLTEAQRLLAGDIN
jgi:F0F1-type ATP synthase delta subunit